MAKSDKERILRLVVVVLICAIAEKVWNMRSVVLEILVHENSQSPWIVYGVYGGVHAVLLILLFTMGMLFGKAGDAVSDRFFSEDSPQLKTE